MDDPSIISKNTARSGVSWSEPIDIHSTAQKYIRLIPFGIPRSGNPDFSFKLEYGHPKRGLTQNGVTFDAKDAKRLLEVLQQCEAVMTTKSAGRFIALKLDLDDGKISGENLDADQLSTVAQALLAQPSVLRTMVEAPKSVTSAVKVAVRISELRTALGELRAYLSTNEDDEATYQDWFKRHSWVFGAEHVEADKNRALTIGDNVDSFVPRLVNGYREIVELKIPSMSVLIRDSAHGNFYFSADVSRAIGQVDRYLEKFTHDGAKGLTDHEEIVAHHPVATIVIGRSDEWGKDQHRALHGLNARLRDIHVITFDYLLMRGERLLEIVMPEK